MQGTIPRVALVSAALLITASTSAAQSNPCGIITGAEAIKHIARGKQTYGQSPEAVEVAGGRGRVCDYPFGGQLGVWDGLPELERFLRMWNADKAQRHSVAGVGDKAWIMFPVPRDKYQDRPAYLVTQVGQKVYSIALFAHDGAADGPIGAACKDQARLKPDEKEDCKKVLADKSETQESLQPAVVELAKLVVAKVRAGKGT